MHLNLLLSTTSYRRIMRFEPMNIARIALLAAAGLTGLSSVTPARAADSEWSRKVSQLITANYSYPRSAQLRGEQGSAKIRISISGTGKILSVDLVQSSGSAILDREAVRIPMKVASFPPPPTHANVELTYPIMFRIEQ
jgi:periplasmic protein TonB